MWLFRIVCNTSGHRSTHLLQNKVCKHLDISKSNRNINMVVGCAKNVILCNSEFHQSKSNFLLSWLEESNWQELNWIKIFKILLSFLHVKVDKLCHFMFGSRLQILIDNSGGERGALHKNIEIEFWYWKLNH